MKQLYCGFIGERPKNFKWGYDEEHEDCIRLRLLLKEKIIRLIERGVTAFISDMSQGVATMAAEIVLELKESSYNQIRLVCALPYEHQAEKWNAQQRERYFDILEASSKVVILQGRYSDDAFELANQWICRYSRYMIAVHREIPNSPTCKKVCYARKRGNFVIQINPDTFIVKNYVPEKNLILACN